MNKTLNVGEQSLLGYLPAIVIQNILDGKINLDNNTEWKKNLPQHYMMRTVSLFADISGFTKLGEAFAKKGRIGPEFLAFSLNRYMEQLINIIGKNGGDIFKFAGDALLVIWPESKKNNNLSDACQRAVQCALEIQSKLHNQEIAGGKRLSIKVGIGVGECTILVVGGQFRRCEYLSVGEALAQACECETKALGGGETICHENVKRYVENVFEFEECKGEDSYGKPIDDKDGKFYRIKKMIGQKVATKADTFLMRSQFSSEKLLKKLPLLKSFVPAAIVKYLDIEKETFSKEIRLLSIMFLNLSIKLEDTRTDEGVARIQNIVNCVQRCIYRTKGALNKFLMDDKGSVMLCCWGLPPLSSSDDHIRAVLTGLSLIQSLKQYECGALMGITTGSCFTGVCGAMGGRREYSLLGGVVNCSARFMQKAIEHAITNNLKYQCMVDETTKDLIQGKIVCEYICDGMLKGFANLWLFYEPKVNHENDKTYNANNPFPDIRTLKNNVPYGKLHQSQKDEKSTYFNKKSLFLVGRKTEFDQCMSDLEQIYKLGQSDIVVIKGVTGSGKSHFVRRLFWQFLESNRELRTKNVSKHPLIFTSYQLPISFTSPLNGFKKIMRKIYDLVKEANPQKTVVTKKFYGEKYQFNCDIIGLIILESDCYSYLKYLNEILDVNLKYHFDSNPKFEKNFQLQELSELDNFFEARSYNGIEKYICDFFVKLIATYYQIINDTHRQTSYLSYPLIFFIEDVQMIDQISLELIRAIMASGLKGIGIVCTYQEPINHILMNPNDKFSKLKDIIDPDKEYFLGGLLEETEISELIKFHISDTLNVTTIDNQLIRILLQKSFKGIPIFIIELVESLLAQKFIQYPSQQLITTSDLDDMDKTGDWNSFVLPIRMEKIIGNIIDSLDVKEIMILKYASVIGNIFDLATLNKINPFNNISNEDLYNTLCRFETRGILEFLNDTSPKKLVCKFAIPFFNVVLYQRMLIEQKNEIHLNVARSLQRTKFSYMPQKEEIRILNKHLKITEKSIINYMEEDDDDLFNKDKKLSEKKSFNINNLKIFYVKELCEKLRSIDLRFNEEEESFKSNIQIIKCGDIQKKSDKGFTWEGRYVAISKDKCYYWYYRSNYEENKMPLGYFELKNLYSADIVPDYQVGGQTNVFFIQVSSWYKKDQLKGPRTYYFSTSTKSDLYCWVIYLNFLRVKATYDNFTKQFGHMNLPLSHELFSKKSKLKNKFKQGNIIKNLNNFSQTAYLKDTFNRKYIPGFYSSKRKKEFHEIVSVSPNRASVIKGRASISQAMMLDSGNDEQESQNKLMKLKVHFKNAFNYSVVSIYSYIMNIIFNLTSIGLRNDEKIVIIPSFIDLNKEDALKDSMSPQRNESLSLSLNAGEKVEKSNIENSASNKAQKEGMIKTNVKISEENEDDSEDSDTVEKKEELKYKKKSIKEKGKITFEENGESKPSLNKSPTKEINGKGDCLPKPKGLINEKKSIMGIISDGVGILTEGIGENFGKNFTKITDGIGSRITGLTNLADFTGFGKNKDKQTESPKQNIETSNSDKRALTFSENQVKASSEYKEKEFNYQKSKFLNETSVKVEKDTIKTSKTKEDKDFGNLNNSTLRLNDKNEFERIPAISEKLLNLDVDEDEDDDDYMSSFKGVDSGKGTVGFHAEATFSSNIFNKR